MNNYSYHLNNGVLRKSIYFIVTKAVRIFENPFLFRYKYQ